jgi:hypothetical protein
VAHTFDTNLRFTGSNNPLTQSYTCGSGATVLCLGIVTGGSVARAGGAPTYNGVSLTQADSTRIYASSPETSCELWYLLAPPTGAAYTISVPNTGTKSLYVQASSYKAASGYTSVLDVENGFTGLTSFSHATVTTTLDGGVIVGVGGGGSDTAPWLLSGTVLNRTDNGTFSDSNQYSGCNYCSGIVFGIKSAIGLNRRQPDYFAISFASIVKSESSYGYRNQKPNNINNCAVFVFGAK